MPHWDALSQQTYRCSQVLPLITVVINSTISVKNVKDVPFNCLSKYFAGTDSHFQNDFLKSKHEHIWQKNASLGLKNTHCRANHI